MNNSREVRIIKAHEELFSSRFLRMVNDDYENFNLLFQQVKDFAIMHSESSDSVSIINIMFNIRYLEAKSIDHNLAPDFGRLLLLLYYKTFIGKIRIRVRNDYEKRILLKLNLL